MLVICAKYVPYCMVYVSDFICGIYMQIIPYIPIKYMAYMPKFEAYLFLAHA